MSAEIIARLNPGGMRLHAGRGTAPELTAEMVAHALGTVRERLGALLLMVKVAQQWRWYPELEAQIGTRYLQGPGRGHEPPPGGLLRRMIRLAVFEQCVPQICRGCKGRAWRQPRRGGRVPCWDCGGEGRVPLSDRQRMLELGMSRADWKDRWSRPYGQLRSLMDEAEHRAGRELQAALTRR